jgi:hypothetical protein
MTASAWKQRIVIAVAALCAAVEGCISDIGAPTSEKSDGNGQSRYYGGPKSPMWSGQQLFVDEHRRRRNLRLLKLAKEKFET